MPTQPVKMLLDRKPEYSDETISRMCSLLREVIDHGTQLIAACEGDARINTHQEQNEDAVVIYAIFMNILEMLDAAEIQIAKQAVAPSVLSLRSVFESFLYLEWILKKDAEENNSEEVMKERARAYFVHDIRDRMKIREAYDPSTEEWKRVKADYEKDKCTQIGKEPAGKKGLADDNKKYEELLAKEPFKPINELFNKQKYLKWYAIHGGGNSVEELARIIHWPYVYWVLYKRWSAVSHGYYGLQGRVRPEGIVKPLRVPENVDDVVGFAVLFGVGAIATVQNYYKPKGIIDFNDWYVLEIKDELEVIQNTNIKIQYVSTKGDIKKEKDE